MLGLSLAVRVMVHVNAASSCGRQRPRYRHVAAEVIEGVQLARRNSILAIRWKLTHAACVAEDLADQQARDLGEAQGKTTDIYLAGVRAICVDLYNDCLSLECSCCFETMKVPKF